MSSIAVFLVLGGATAFAAKKIGSNEIKSNAITTGKIKKNAVTTAKIKNDAVTGAKVKESSLGTVPSATSAGNANTVGSQSAHKLRTVIAEGQTNVQVASISGFTITASCGANDADVTITPPSGPGSILMAGGVPQSGAANTTTRDWAGNKPGETGGIQVDNYSAGGDASYGISSVNLTTTDGAVVSGTISYDYDAFENSSDCIVFGHLLAG
jgi:hypothetical protein